MIRMTKQLRAAGRCLAVTLLIFCTPVWAQTYPAPSSGKKHRPSLSAVSEVATSQDVELLVKQGRLLQLPGIASKIMVADPKVASFQVSSPSSVFVFGEGAGTTSLYAMDAADNVIAAMRLVVTFDLAQLRKQVEAEVPGTHVEIVPAGDKALIVRGSVKTPINARQVMSTISAAIGAPDEGGGKGGGGGGGGGGGTTGQNGESVPRLINQLSVRLSSQINIRVRVVEVSRRLSHQLGLNWDSVLNDGKFRIATGGLSTLFSAAKAGGAVGPKVVNLPSAHLIREPNTFGYTASGLTGVLNALNQEGLATLLAEPNLTAMSGETASFAAGGEVPVVVITNNNVNIDYKSYGVIMRMTPTLLSPNRISLRIAPEVSDLSKDGAVTLDTGSTIPAFKVRRAETTIELASGQSFALAGMLSNRHTQQVDGLPGFDRVPLIGQMFETDTSNQEGVELVILATAYVVEPTKDGALQTPGKGLPSLDERSLPASARAGFVY